MLRSPNLLYKELSQLDKQRNESVVIVTSRGGSRIKRRNVPNLIHVVISALPHLDFSPSNSSTICEIETLALISPCNAVVAGDRELLVCITSIASIDLHKLAILYRAVGDIETFITEDLDVPTSNIPSLASGGWITNFDINCSVVRITGSGQAKGSVVSR